MTRSEEIIIAAGQALIDKLLSTRDDIQFADWLRHLHSQFSLGWSTLASIAGIETDAIMWKQRAGGIVRAKQMGLDPVKAYVAGATPYIGKRLTREEHGDPDALSDWQSWWLENCPPEYKAHVLALAVDTPPKSIEDMAWPIEHAYLTILGRPAEQGGLNYWYSQNARGESLNKIFWHISKSKEANDRRAGG